MRKRLLIWGIILVLVTTAVFIFWRVFDLSSDYNYATAKLDIKNGNVKIIHVGAPQVSSKDKEIEQVAARYGFKNVYIEKYTEQQTKKGVRHYNDLAERYLTFRNGLNWKKRYQREIDSLHNLAE